MRLLIKNGRVVDPGAGRDEMLDVLIEGGQIVEVAPAIERGEARVLDASGLVVAPGFIDMHVHAREPGQEHKEDLRTASLAAARGGFTSICAMPNTKPVNDSVEVTSFIVAEARKKAVVNVFPVAAITRGLAGEELSPMADLLEAGAAAFSDDGRCIRDGGLMLRALEEASRLGALVIDHCEDASLSRDGVMHEGAVSRRLGVRGIPSAAEDVMVARDVILAAAVPARVHIAHVSTGGAVDAVRAAKLKGVRVTAEATPHHLVLSDAALAGLDPNFKVNPPLRGPEDVRALRTALAEGVIDVLATDHAPHAPEEKAAGFERAPFGIDGLETAVPVLLDRLVSGKVIGLGRFIEMLSTAPARILGLANKGSLLPGADADVTILDLQAETVVDVRRFASKSRNTPFDGWRLRGGPAITIVGGRVIYPG
ncbi:MAG: dihydroorotase [Candidatus Aminicenantes bacterium RBG_16_63_16]|nr:MAG: dihydroorotase [Candidatus Aminicenantes bacterium RBG_16_63_16]